MEESIYFQAKDLMLGDWIKIGKIPLRVIQLTHFTHKDDSVVLETGSEYLDVEPIPLTAEILEKNGFVRSSVFVEWKYEEEGVYILWKPFPFLKIETENVQLNLSGCEYVHELQNALRLCGINKTIEI